MQVLFQSRNRGSFDFKPASYQGTGTFRMFQSRNRGSFDFKEFSVYRGESLRSRFNLVIEVLLISRKKDWQRLDSLKGFNLVIEVLLISS